MMGILVDFRMTLNWHTELHRTSLASSFGVFKIRVLEGFVRERLCST